MLVECQPIWNKSAQVKSIWIISPSFKGKCGYPWESTLAVVLKILPHIALYNHYISHICGICWYISQVLSQGYPTFPFESFRVNIKNKLEATTKFWVVKCTSLWIWQTKNIPKNRTVSCLDLLVDLNKLQRFLQEIWCKIIKPYEKIL